jgi:hypothetical protein
MKKTAKATSKGRSARAGLVVKGAGFEASIDSIESSHGKTYKVRFGSVTIRGGAPAAAVVRRNVALGQSALKRGFVAFAKPGVKLPRSKGVPKYRADPNDPTILIRELNGRDERGTLADGKFKIAE